MLGLAAVQETKVLAPWDVDEHAQAALLGLAQEPFGRHMVRAQRVDAGSAHEVKVVAYAFRRGERFPASVGREGAVGHTTKPHALMTAGKEPAVDAQAGTRARLAIADEVSLLPNWDMLDYDCVSIIHGAHLVMSNTRTRPSSSCTRCVVRNRC